MNPQGSHHAEFLDLSNPTATCDIIPQYPIDDDWAVGLNFYEIPVICGGSISNVYYDSCYAYDFDDRMWVQSHPLKEPRAGAFSLQLGSDEFVIMGGMTTGERVLSSTELYTYTGTEGNSSNMALPEPMANFSGVTLNATHAFIAAGKTSHLPEVVISQKTYLLNYDKNYWMTLPDIPASDWTECHTSGFIINTQGQQEIVMVGRQSTWIYNFEQEAWRPSNEVPGNLWCAGSIQYEDHFLLIGGANADFTYYSDKIYYFGTEEVWVELSATLDYARVNPVAFKVSDEHADCI